MRTRWLLILITLVALIVRVGLVWAEPLLPGGDSVTRLFEVREVFKLVWLPLYQALLATVSLVTLEPVAFRLVSAGIGAAAAASTGGLVAHLAGLRAGWVSGGVVALGPLFVQNSVGLYQEPLFLLLCTSGLWAALDGRDRLSGVLLVAATLTRYEGWLLVPAFLLVRRAWRPLLAVAVVVVGWTTASRHWLATPWLEPESSLEGLADQIGHLLDTAWRSGLLSVFVVALFGPALWPIRDPSRRRWWLGLWIVGALATGTVLFLTPYTPENPRQLLLPAAFAALCAGLVLGTRDSERLPVTWGRRAAIGLIVVELAWSWTRVTAERPNTLRAAALAGQALGGTPGLVFSEGFPEYPDTRSELCAVISVYSQERWTCDSEVDDLETWLQAHPEAPLIWVGTFSPWRPAHRQAALLPWTQVGPLHVYQRQDSPLELSAVEDALDPVTPCAMVLPEDVPLDPLTVEGRLVHHEPGRIAFYGNGTASLVAPRSGQLSVWSCGTPLDEAPPELVVESAKGRTSITPARAYRATRIGSVAEGEVVHLVFTNDAATDDEDRNVFVGRIAIHPP